MALRILIPAREPEFEMEIIFCVRHNFTLTPNFQLHK